LSKQNNTMQAHQQRVIEEKTELDAKREKLDQFIQTSIAFPTLPGVERERLREQLRVMGEYSDILDQRIAAFSAQ
jgi:hypothetical protein